jgi:hypothetical protein
MEKVFPTRSRSADLLQFFYLGIEQQVADFLIGRW